MSILLNIPVLYLIGTILLKIYATIHVLKFV